MSRKSLVLVDGSYYLFRAYHAMPAFTNAAGEPTGAIFGVMNMIQKLLTDYDPDYFAVIFDAKGKNFRNDLYPEYKANRPPMPDELASQIEPLHEIIRAAGFPLLIVDDVEADDVIATLAKNAEASGYKTVVSTGDKDLAQIVNKQTSLINTMTNRLLDPDGVVEKFGVPPARIVDYLALVGDSIDNVPGVPKVGAKTAAKWLNEYGSLEEITRNADTIKGKVGENLRNSLDQLELSKQLVTLNTDVALDFDIQDLVCGEADVEVLKKAYKRWGFNSWLARLEPEKANNTGDGGNPGKASNYEIITTKKGLEGWIERFEKADLIAVDTETTSLNYMQAKLVGLSFAVTPHEAAYVPVGHDYPDAPDQLDLDYVLKKAGPILESAKIAKVGHNLKYDKNVLANYNIDLAGIKHDTMIESYVLNSTSGRHDMDSLALKYLEHETTHYEDVAGKGAKQIPFNQVPVETAAHYAAEDADITLRLHEYLWPRLCKEKGLRDVYESLEVPLINVLSRMERNGVLIDADMLKKQGAELKDRMAGIEAEAQEIAGEEFNIGSPKQIQRILYEKLSLPVLSKTPKGQPSTAEPVLQELALEHELPGLILEHRAMSKLKSTYTDKLPEQIDPSNGRVHTSYQQAVASTGRLSSTEPNLQNIPVRSEQGRKIREAFIARKGCKIVAADYSQIELRIMAHLSRDKTLVKAFSNKEDIHTKTAAEIFSVDLEKVSSEQRRAAKAINFGLIYGMSAFGLSKQLGVNVATARDYVERYFDKYPGVKKYMDEIRERARSDGYVETVFRRRLYLPEINSRNAARRQYAERTAINAPMQGTAADLIKRAMIEIDRKVCARSNDVKMIMQVHDELVFEIKNPSVNNSIDEIREIMSSAPEISVPLVVDVGQGDSWEQAH